LAFAASIRFIAASHLTADADHSRQAPDLTLLKTQHAAFAFNYDVIPKQSRDAGAEAEKSRVPLLLTIES